MKVTKKNRFLIIAGLMILIAITGVVICLVSRNNSNQQTKEEDEVYSTLSASDQETADLYAEFYETSAEDVAKIQAKTGNWEQTEKELEKEFFTIPENIKYQMSKEGYSIEDLEEAETLSAKTGRKAMELAKAKGKESENRSWSDVVKDSEILSAEEQLGLSKEQMKQLKDRSLEKEERMEAAVLILNEKYTFDEIIQSLDDGKTIIELKEQK